MRRRKITFFVSGHGYGHATRQITIINRLVEKAPDIQIMIRSEAPRWLFENNVKAELDFQNLKTDVGVVQRDSLHLDKRETLRQADDFFENVSRLVDAEVEHLSRQEVDLVVGDISPLAFEIASRLKVPGIGISNFSWDWIYAPYVREHPEYSRVIDIIRGGYGKADLLLRLPFYGDTSAFKEVWDVPLVGRRSAATKEEVRERYDLPSGKKLVLLSFGTYGLKEFNLEKIEKLDDYFFIATFMLKTSLDNLLCLPGHNLVHEDLVAACEVVMTKPGYGIVAEILINRTPVLYTSRGDFPEYDELVKGLERYSNSLFIPNRDFLSGQWGDYLRTLAERDFEWPQIDCSGDQRAAEVLLGSCTGGTHSL
jgi:UDP:flavonoid glycosyltransferase YjiC (YdhE family)